MTRKIGKHTGLVSFDHFLDLYVALETMVWRADFSVIKERPPEIIEYAYTFEKT